MRRPNIKLHIEELVLNGFAAGDRYAIADAVQQELSRLLGGQFGGEGVTSSLSNNSSRPQVDAGAFQVAPGSKANSIGVQIARSVHGGMSK